MRIELTKIKVRDLYEGYLDEEEDGITGYNERLNIRPAYQREFVYKDKQRDAVIDTIRRGLPLNVMYWVKNEDDTYELLDGQQRTISICSYLSNDYSINEVYFHSLPEDEKQKILDYELYVYICSGNESERLEWFNRINIAGEKLTDQELLNSQFTGPWLSEAKRKFSKTGCVAYNLGSKYVTGSPIRQEYLETALDWISGGHIKEYMSQHQHDTNANELWLYFNSVIEWVKATFGEANYRKEMQKVQWGHLYNKYKNNSYDPAELERQVKELMENEEVTDKKGIYEYVLSGKDPDLARKLSKRAFSAKDMRRKYEEQGGICPRCGEHHEFEEMEGDHIVPWSEGGTTTYNNLQMLCKKCNRAKH